MSLSKKAVKKMKKNFRKSLNSNSGYEIKKKEGKKKKIYSLF